MRCTTQVLVTRKAVSTVFRAKAALCQRFPHLSSPVLPLSRGSFHSGVFRAAGTAARFLCRIAAVLRFLCTAAAFVLNDLRLCSRFPFVVDFTGIRYSIAAFSFTFVTVVMMSSFALRTAAVVWV